jgi:UV DNA damage endonuclease
MNVRVGYACVNTQLPSSSRTTRLDRVTPERILELSRANLAALADILRWNINHHISLFRISSGIIPFGSHPANSVRWWQVLRPDLEEVGTLIRENGMRVSMHPGQYTVLSTPRPEVAKASLAELEYHARFLDSLGLDYTHKLVVHLGGVYGDPAAAMDRFAANFARLSKSPRRRLVLENDEKNYKLAQAIELSSRIGTPVVFDIFHHSWNPSFPQDDLLGLISRAAATWQPHDGRQKMHYSDQWPGKQPGSHSQSVDLDAFARFYAQVRHLPLDVMLEVKDKEQSVLLLHEVYPELG